MCLHIVVLDMVGTSLAVTSAPRSLRLESTDIVGDVEASVVSASTDVDVAAAAGVPAVRGAMVGVASTLEIRLPACPMMACPVVSSGSGNGCGSWGGEGDRIGRSLAGKSGSEAHGGGRDKGMPYMRVLISEILVLFLNHRTRVASLMMNSRRLVPSSRA